MKIKLLIAGIAMAVFLDICKATSINIPDGNFQNVNAVITPPPIIGGTTSGNIGTWSAAFTNLVNVGGQMASSNAAAVGWITPPGGSTYELKITMPASLAAGAGISEVLTNCLKPNSVYTLSVALSQQTTAGLLAGSTLSLFASGATNLATIGGTNLLNLFTNQSGFQTVTLTYKTPNTVPTNAIGIGFATTGLATIGGSVFVDNFQLSVNPIQVQFGSFVTTGHSGAASTITLTGQNGDPGAKYEIITSTNLQVLTPTWVQVVTNQFDTNGNFSQTFTIDPLTPYRFYRTEVP